MLNLDTHVLLYALAGELTRRGAVLLSREAWPVSAIVLREIGKLAALGRIDLDEAELVRTLARIHGWPLTLDICRAIRQLDFRGDPADEIIAATSLVHRVRLVTRDARIRKSRRVPLSVWARVPDLTLLARTPPSSGSQPTEVQVGGRPGMGFAYTRTRGGVVRRTHGDQ